MFGVKIDSNLTSRPCEAIQGVSLILKAANNHGIDTSVTEPHDTLLHLFIASAVEEQHLGRQQTP
jgi:hypothetical protein